MVLKPIGLAAACAINLLGRTPNDYDVATSAHPEQIAMFFEIAKR